MKLLHSLFLSPLLLCAAPLTAQLPSTACITTTAVATSFLEATIIVLVEPNSVHCFSTYFKRWFTLPTATTATIVGHDDHVIIRDGNEVYAFATRFGAFQHITVSGTPVISGGGGPTHVSIVVDGSTAHFFSDITGSWSQVTFAATPSIAVNKLVGVATDGAQTVGFSAQRGTPTQLAANGVTSVAAAGYCGQALSPGFIHLYSATRDTWRTEPVPATATVYGLSARTSIVAMRDGTTYTLWSAFTDTVATVAATGNAILSYGDHAVVIVDDPIIYSFAASMGTVQNQPMPGASLGMRTSYYVLVNDGVDLRAFSGMTGTWAVLPGGVGLQITTNAMSSTAMVMDGAAQVCHCFSSLTGQWHASPQLNGATAYSTYSGGVLSDSAGLIGFSAMDGSFTALPGEVPTRTVQFGSNWGCETASGLHVFNPILPAWRSKSTLGPVGQFLAHHGALIAEDGLAIYFYGTSNDEWTQLLTGVGGTIARSDELGWVNIGNTYCGIGASGQCVNDSTFPEWWRIMTHGSTTRWFVTAEVGSLPVLVMSTGTADVTIPGIGHLGVDPLSAALTLMPPVPLTGPSMFSWNLPDVPAIVGFRLHAQAAVLKASGLYLTNVYRSTVF